MLQEDEAITSRFNLQFPNLFIKVFRDKNKDGLIYKISFDAYAKPGDVKKIKAFANKLKLGTFELDRIPF